MPKRFRPLLAAKAPEDPEELEAWVSKYLGGGNDELFASPKIDGIRAIVLNGVVYSRALKPIRSRFVQEYFGRLEYEGLDGELVLGDPRDPGAFNRTTSAVMTEDADIPVTFWVFDRVVAAPYTERYATLGCIEGHPYITLVPQDRVSSLDGILALEESYVNAGFEGLMLRSGSGHYKYGRSTLREGLLVKLKRFTDSEALVVGFVEMNHNLNSPERDALGLQKRSASKEGKTPAGILGTLVVEDLHSGKRFEIGTGFTEKERIEIWRAKERYLGRIAKYKYQSYGQLDRPRAPVFLGFRDPLDV